jgi:hypothetical protein
MKRKGLMILFVLCVSVWFSGCAMTLGTTQKPYRVSERRTLIWQDEFEFMIPPLGWKLVQVESGGEFGFGFIRSDPGPFPSQSVFVYDEEPFGCSTKFEEREEEFFKRYLWAAAISMNMKILERKKINVVGGEGLEVIAEGIDTVKKEKVRSKVVFGKRGERVVSWYLTQWRPIDESFDPSAFEVFDRFVESFNFLKKSFYEML